MTTFEKYKAEFAFFAFTTIWFILSFYNRVSLDDWCLSNFVKGVTYQEFIINFWQNYEGAFASVTANFIAFKLINQSHFFGILFNEFALVGFLGALIFLLKKAANYLDLNFSKFSLISFVLIIFFSLYILQPQHKGVFFNYNWSICYFLPITIFILALALLLGNRIINTIAAVFLFFILGAWKLHYSLTFISVLGSLYLLGIYFKSDTGLRSRLIYSIISLAFSTTIYLTAPGNFVRLARMNPDSQQLGLFQNLMNTKLVNWFLYYKNIAYHPGNLALAILFIIFFSTIKHDYNNRINKFILHNYARLLIYSTSWIILVTFFNGLFFSVVAGSITYVARVYVLMYFLIALYLILVTYLISLRVQIKFLVGNGYIPFLVILIICGYFLFKIPGAMSYAKAFDHRESSIKSEVSNSRSADLYVDVLPPSGVFETGEFTSKGDSSMSFVNDCAKEYYHAKFNIYQVKKMNYE